MKTKIIFASHNAGKIHELETLLTHVNIDIIPQQTMNVADIPETGLTFVENAILKARHASAQTGLPAIADDSGLDVFALKGEPGIFSARYAGDKATSKDNIQKLLANMTHLSGVERHAAFHCVLVYLNHPEDPMPLICQGSWQGSILTIPTGEQGFGYDPVFYDSTYQCSAAELSIETKNKISHRGQALQKLLALLSHKMEL